MFAVLAEDTFEIVVNSVGVAESIAGLVGKYTHWQTTTSFT